MANEAAGCISIASATRITINIKLRLSLYSKGKESFGGIKKEVYLRVFVSKYHHH